MELEIKSANEMRQLLLKEIERFIGMEKDISSQLKLEEELAIYRNALLQTQLSLRSDLVESINAAMREIWAIFYPYGDYKEIRLSASEKDYLFELYDSNWKALESVASGGERACAALTLRVALAMVLTPNLSWLILDEPTHNLDREAVELLSETLQTKVPEVVNQTFVITHEEGLMGSEFASSYKFTRNKSKFEGTKAEKI
jgi:exonuclease SbcC